MTKFLRDLPIDTKLTGLSVIASVLALVLACSAFVAYDLVTFRDVLARRIKTQARIVGTNSAAAILFDDAEAARGTLAALRAERGVTSAVIYDAAGTPVATYRRDETTAVAAPGVPEEESIGHRFRADYLEVYEPIVFENDRIGMVAIRSELQEVTERATRYLGIAGLVLVLSFLIAFLVSSRLKQALLRPFLSLADVAEKVSLEKDYSVRAVRDSEDETGRVIDTFNDMLSTIERRDRELQEARDQALEASQLKSAFLANMSHEIRTPLNVILGYSNVIVDTLEDQTEHDESLQAIRRASKRLMDTIDGILNISRIETKNFQVTPVPLSLAEIVRSVAADVRVLANQANLRLELIVDAPEAVVRFDEYCLSQALVNLAQNAIKFTREGEVEIRVHRGEDGDLRVSVRDTGIGMDAGYLPKLFEPFSQEDAGYTRAFEGTGLGLALTHRYLELNGATVSAVSHKGAGSTFTIRFPKEIEITGEPLPEAKAEPAPVEALPAALHPNGRPGVLVVEDHLDTLAYMRRIVGNRYHVFEATDSQEAREMLSAHDGEIHLILMDLALRGGDDGLRLTREIHGEDRWKHMPIIATTAHVFPEDRARARAAGCAAFVPKPVDQRALLAMMNACLS